jgi:hypothetical protein
MEKFYAVGVDLPDSSSLTMRRFRPPGMAEFQHHRAGGRAKVRWRAPLQSAPCGVLAQRYALFPRLSLRPDGPRGFALPGSCRALAASMRLVLAFPLHSALRMPPTPPPASPCYLSCAINRAATNDRTYRSGAIYRAKSNEEINGKQKTCSGAGAPSGLAERGSDSRMSRMDAAKGGV